MWTYTGELEEGGSPGRGGGGGGGRRLVAHFSSLRLAGPYVVLYV